MEALEQLENRIDALLGRLHSLKAENARLLDEAAAQAQDKTALAQENQALRDALCKEESLRTEAAARIDALLRKIQDFDNIG